VNRGHPSSGNTSGPRHSDPSPRPGRPAPRGSRRRSDGRRGSVVFLAPLLRLPDVIHPGVHPFLLALVAARGGRDRPDTGLRLRKRRRRLPRALGLGRSLSVPGVGDGATRGDSMPGRSSFLESWRMASASSRSGPGTGEAVSRRRRKAIASGSRSTARRMIKRRVFVARESFAMGASLPAPSWPRPGGDGNGLGSLVECANDLLPIAPPAVSVVGLKGAAAWIPTSSPSTTCSPRRSA
jgi:hypothetical protein